jgi:hypothetical protein
MCRHAYVEAVRFVALYLLQTSPVRNVYEGDVWDRALNKLLERDGGTIGDLVEGRFAERPRPEQERPETVTFDQLRDVLGGKDGAVPFLLRDARVLMKRSLINAAESVRRQHARRDTIPLELIPARPSDIECRDRREAFAWLFARLRPPERAILERTLEGQSSMDIGLALGLTPGSVDTARHRGLAKIRPYARAAGL